MTLVQCNFAHRPNVGPTCWANVGTMSNMSSSDISPTMGQRMLHITNVDQMLDQRLPNVGSTLTQYWFDVAVTFGQ